jgi:LacI family transcriptional regulator
MRVTIYDIADRLGISTSTVSRALSRKENSLISENTRERVRRTAEEMGYRPNALARALITGRTLAIGLYTRSMEERVGPHFARMLEAVELKASELGYQVLMSGALDTISAEGRIDGVVALARPDDEELVSALRGRPCVFVMHGPEAERESVMWNDFEGAYKAGQYLVSMGHRKVCMLIGNTTHASNPAFPKAKGFRQAMTEAGVSPQECLGGPSEDEFENGYLLTTQLLAHSPDITAIFARNDFLALGAMKALRHLGKSVPEDVSVIGYNDTVLAKCSDPSLTSVHTPIGEAGVIAVEHLIGLIERRSEGFPGIMLPTTLTLRDSSGLTHRG